MVLFYFNNDKKWQKKTTEIYNIESNLAQAIMKGYFPRGNSNIARLAKLASIKNSKDTVLVHLKIQLKIRANQKKNKKKIDKADRDKEYNIIKCF